MSDMTINPILNGLKQHFMYRRKKMISKEEYIQGETEDAWSDPKFVNQVLYDYFKDQVKHLTDKEFKSYLVEDLGWEINDE